MLFKFKNVLFAIATCFLTTHAFAQNESMDPVPQPPRLTPKAAPEVVHQAGVGSDVSYARAGVVELGGNMTLSSADNFTDFGLEPMVGFFFGDNLELSGFINWHYGKVAGVTGHHIVSLLVEPSFHVPLTATQFAFAGLGVGALFQTDETAASALSPRVGFQMLMGRSGLLTLDAQAIYGLNRSSVQTLGGTVLTVKSAYGLGAGYTILL